MPKDKSAVLVAGDSYHNANLYYATKFLAGDRFLYLAAHGKEYVLLTGFEKGRAERESRVKQVVGLEDHGYLKLVKETNDPDRAFVGALAQFLGRIKVKNVRVPGDFPLRLADDLRAAGLQLQAADLAIEADRMVKTKEEIGCIREAQRVNEKALAKAIGLIRKADVKRGILHRKGEPLTAEALQRAIEVVFTKHGFEARDSIVAAGPRSADPHFAGEGPIPAGVPIVIDIFPQGKKSRYYSDMTRTVVRGKPTKAVKKMYDLTLQAQEIALRAIRPGATGKAVFDQVCDFYERHGYGTLRTGATTKGFIHSLGHGVGLEIHEDLRLSMSGLKPLVPGNVVTVEPGLYDPEIGGVRIEDIVVVTKAGCENLTRFPKELIV